MKLKLEQKDGIAVLEVTGAVDAHSFQILKAGLTKLLKDGKNKIILKCEDSPKLESDVIRELAILDMFARELSGKIVITSASEELKKSVIQFSKPPMIPYFASVDAALTFFKLKQSDEEESEESVAALQQALEAKTKEVEALQQKLKLVDANEVRTLRADKASLQAKVNELLKQVDELLDKEREPMEMDGFLGKIEALEDTVKKLGELGLQKG